MIPKCNRRILRSLVRMVDHLIRPSLIERHLQCSQDQLTTHMIGHRPTDNLAIEYIEYYCQVHEALPGRDIRDVCDPQLIRCDSRECPVYQVWRWTIIIVSYRRGHPFTSSDTSKPTISHQSCNSFTTHTFVVLNQLGMDTGDAISTA